MWGNDNIDGVSWQLERTGADAHALTTFQTHPKCKKGVFLMKNFKVRTRKSLYVDKNNKELSLGI